MSEAAAELVRLRACVDEAAAALAQARFGQFSEAAAKLETAELETLCRAGLYEDVEAVAACRGLRRSLDRLGALLGHVSGVQQALRELDPANMTVYGRGGAAAAGGSRLVREEA